MKGKGKGGNTNLKFAYEADWPRRYSSESHSYKYMRSSYFIFFALAAIVPGLMIGALISSGTAVQSQDLIQIAQNDQGLQLPSIPKLELAPAREPLKSSQPLGELPALPPSPGQQVAVQTDDQTLQGLSAEGFAYDRPDTWLQRRDTAAYRPPQFVLISFDAASRSTLWDSSTQTMARAKAKLTYFISASSLVLESRAKEYLSPTGDHGRSWVDFAISTEELLALLERINAALDQGHDVAFQGVGFHRGEGWSVSDWRSELEQAEKFIRGAYKDNGLDEPADWQAKASQILAGFRAREQFGAEALYVAQQDGLFLYDSSGQSIRAEWPKKEEGVWRFDLPILLLNDGRRILAQDLDFFIRQTNARGNKAEAKKHEEEMYELLVREFELRYASNRAPMLVALHFAHLNEKAYWNATQRFAELVCDKPEVVCTNHKNLAKYLNQLDQDLLLRIGLGEFPAYDAEEEKRLATLAAQATNTAVLGQVKPEEPNLRLPQLVPATQEDPKPLIEIRPQSSLSLQDTQTGETAPVASTQLPTLSLPKPSTTLPQAPKLEALPKLSLTNQAPQTSNETSVGATAALKLKNAADPADELTAGVELATQVSTVEEPSLPSSYISAEASDTAVFPPNKPTKIANKPRPKVSAPKRQPAKPRTQPRTQPRAQSQTQPTQPAAPSSSSGSFVLY